MVISIIVNPIYVYGEEGWSPDSTRLGGSEEFVVEVAKRLKHKVTVFHNGKHGTYEGVKYKAHADYMPGDLTINVNFPEFAPNGKTIYWTSLDKNPNLDKFDAVCVISEYAKNNTGLIHNNIHIIPPGYDPTKIYPEDKIPKQCFYASSPDRGLDILLEAWPKVVQAHPDATLLITYGGRIDLPGVISFGEVDEQTMSEIYRSSDIWSYPCTGVELYGMTGIKAQASGCIPVIIPHMALAETVRRGYKTDKQHYAQTLITALETDNTSIREALAKEKYPTWDEVTNKLEKLINLIYAS